MGGGDQPCSLPGFHAGCSGTLGTAFAKVPARLASPLRLSPGNGVVSPHSRRREGVAHSWEKCFGVTLVRSRPLAPCGAALYCHAAEGERRVPLPRAVLPLQINDGANITLSLGL